MKKALILTVILAFFAAACCSVTAQTPSKVGNPESYMTPEQLGKYYSDLKIADLEKRLETYGNWVGVGGEVGTAINEGLSAVVDVADEFGKTNVGKFTMILVAWKVVGKDIVRIVLGLIFLTMFTWLLIYSFRRTCIDRRIVIEKKNPGFMQYPKEKKYELIEPLFGDGDGLGAIRILHLVLFMIGIGITYGIMF